MSWRGSITVERHDDPPDTMTIAFDPPIDLSGGGTLDKLELKEPTAKQVREAEKEHRMAAGPMSQVAYELKLVGIVAGITNQKTLDQLPIGAVNYGAEFLAEFVEAGPADDESDEAAAPGECVLMPIDPPLKFAGETYAELDLHEPLASQLRQARQLLTNASLFESRRAQMHLVASVTALPAPVIDALPIRTLNAAGRVLSRFTMVGRRTGRS